MLYLVHMIVDIPSTLPAEEAARIKAEEKAYCALRSIIPFKSAMIPASSVR